MAASYIRVGAVALSLLSAQALLAYERPLDTHSIREAYFLGSRKDDKAAKFLGQYQKRLPVPKTGSHVAEIGIRTPYSQVVLRSFQAPGNYSAQQAEQDYQAQPDRIVVRVRINLTPTYPGYLPDPTRGKGAIRERPPDFWRDFEIRVVQGKTIRPGRVRGRPLYPSTLVGPVPPAGALEGAEVELEFDTALISSAPVRVEVLTPDGQTVEAEFDLKELR